jgi:hypothetical protein
VGSPALLFSLLSTLSSDTRALPDGDLQGMQAVQQRKCHQPQQRQGSNA